MQHKYTESVENQQQSAVANNASYFRAIESLPISVQVCATLRKLFRHRNGRTGRCNPSIKTLTKQTHLSEHTVRVHLRKAEKAGWLIVKEHRRKNQSQTSNHYYLSESALNFSMSKRVPNEGPEIRPSIFLGSKRKRDTVKNVTPPFQKSHPSELPELSLNTTYLNLSPPELPKPEPQKKLNREPVDKLSEEEVKDIQTTYATLFEDKPNLKQIDQFQALQQEHCLTYKQILTQLGILAASPFLKATTRSLNRVFFAEAALKEESRLKRLARAHFKSGLKSRAVFQNDDIHLAFENKNDLHQWALGTSRELVGNPYCPVPITKMELPFVPLETQPSPSYW